MSTNIIHDKERTAQLMSTELRQTSSFSEEQFVEDGESTSTKCNRNFTWLNLIVPRVRVAAILESGNKTARDLINAYRYDMLCCRVY